MFCIRKQVQALLFLLFLCNYAKSNSTDLLLNDSGQYASAGGWTSTETQLPWQNSASSRSANVSVLECKHPMPYTSTEISYEMVTESVATPADSVHSFPDQSASEAPDNLIIRNTGLRIYFTSSTSGYIKSPVRRPATSADRPLSLFMGTEDNTAVIRVPEHHVLMVSLPVIKMTRGSGCTITNGLVLEVNEEPVWVTCKTVHPAPTLHQEAQNFTVGFHVRFSESKVTQVSFELRFSFHRISNSNGGIGSVPEQLTNGLWNCFAPSWPYFRQHLRCNLKTECVEGDDEVNCTFHSDVCAPDQLSISGSCYKYIQPSRSLTWEQASDVCQGQGGQLISLNTEEEWRAVSKILSTTNFGGIFLGLSGRNPVQLSVYRNILTWSDESKAYFRYIDKSSDSAQDFYILQENFDVNLDVFQAIAKDTVPEIDLPDPFRTILSVLGGFIFPINLKFGSTTFLKPNNSNGNDGPFINILCESEVSRRSPTKPTKDKVTLAKVISKPFAVPVVRCPKGHKTHTFLACDVRSSCWARGYGSAFSCDAPLTPLPPSFTCKNGIERVPFTLLCDHRQDCGDGSDEDFCVFSECGGVGLMKCGNQQCLPFRFRCDGIEDCANGVDEQWCMKKFIQNSTQPPPASLYLDGRGSFYVTPHPHDVTVCPEDTFQCNTPCYCLPTYMRCNGLYDCPSHEDEDGCEDSGSVCPGYYRCRDSRICLHPNFVCDGLHQCPNYDDELLCGFTCPVGCECFGLSAYCKDKFSAHHFPELRFLEALGTGMKLNEMFNNSMLVHLGLGNCSIQQVDSPSLPNLKYLDLSDNLLKVSTGRDFQHLPSLQVLILDGNPLVSEFFVDMALILIFQSLEVLRVSMVSIKRFNTDMLEPFKNLRTLNLSFSNIDVLDGRGLGFLTELASLDVTGCPLTKFPRDIMKGLRKLDTVHADNYKMCCPATLPDGFNLADCHAPSDEVSSCDALLRSDAYRVVLSVFAALAILGNLGSFLYRVIISKVQSRLGYGVFVTHLTVSDFMMGVYLAIIGVADRVYLGSYLWDDVTWKKSTACQVAGFLSLLSSEVSALIICLITLDRVLVLRFPFGQVRFRKTSAHVACSGAWLMGVVLAGIPLLPGTSHWGFYSQNGICVPLPITRNTFPGHDYSFSVMIVFNFILFLFIAAGQVVIFWTVKQSSMDNTNTTKTSSNDLAIAQRLISVALSDFLCWFPIGVLGLLASTGTPIPGEVNVAMAIFVLPLNSALNPFLYTLNMVLERRSKAKEKRIQQMILSAQRSNSTVVTKQ